MISVKAGLTVAQTSGEAVYKQRGVTGLLDAVRKGSLSTEQALDVLNRLDGTRKERLRTILVQLLDQILPV